MIFHLGNFKRTKLDNVFQYTDGDEIKFFDFNQLTELEVNENDFVVLNDNNLKIKRDDLEFRRFYTTVPEGYKRLIQYGNHTFHERIYYYNKEENQIIVYKDDGKLMSLIPSVYNKRHGFSVVNDRNKTVIVFPGLIIEHLNE